MPECKICFNIYNELNPPLLLIPCGHSICSSCHKGLRGNKTCPFDSQPITASPINSNILFYCKDSEARNETVPPVEIIDEEKKTSAEEQSQGPLCDICDQPEEEGESHFASMYCEVCNLYMCEKLGAAHIKNPRTKAHNITASKEVITPTTPTTTEQSQEDYMCEFHQRPLEVWCRDDMTLCCVMCLVSTHKNHMVVAPENVFKRQATDMLGGVLEKLKDLAGALEGVEHVQSMNSKSHEATLSLVDTAFDQVSWVK